MAIPSPGVLLVGPYDPHCGEYTFLAPPLGVWRLAGVLEAAGVLRGINWSKITPQDLVEMKLYRQCVQVLGKPAILRRFNSV